MDEALPLPFNFDNELMNFVLSVSDLFSCDQEMLRVMGCEQASMRFGSTQCELEAFPPINSTRVSIWRR